MRRTDVGERGWRVTSPRAAGDGAARARASRADLCAAPVADSSSRGGQSRGDSFESGSAGDLPTWIGDRAVVDARAAFNSLTSAASPARQSPPPGSTFLPPAASPPTGREFRGFALAREAWPLPPALTHAEWASALSAPPFSAREGDRLHEPVDDAGQQSGHGVARSSVSC